jgi:hypothetical protein
LTAEPVVTLTIGTTSLNAFVWGYRYEEQANDQGGLTIWLDNRDDEFDDLANDYADIKRGAAIDLRRGLGANTVKLPRTWIEGLAYRYIEGAALLELQCIDWRERLNKFRYSTAQTWSATEIATIASSGLGQVSLTLASGSFSFTTDFIISPRRNAEQALVDLMRRVDEYLYAGLDGEIKHKELDPNEAAGYTYDWSAGGGSNHPMMRGSEVAETSPKFTKVTVNGGPALEYTGSAEDSDESTLMGTRLRTVTDRDLTSDAQCTERARAELRFWLAQTVRGRIIARPNFTLAMYDVLTMNAPAWGGPNATGRVRRIVEEYGRGVSLWQQIIDIGGLAGRTLPIGFTGDGYIGPPEIDQESITRDEVKDGEIVADKIAANAVVASKIDVDDLSAISADMGTLTAGIIKMGTGTKDSDLDGFQIDATELVGQENGVDQVVLSASDGKITAGAGAVVLDADGIHAASGTADINKHKVKDGADIILAMYGEVDSGVGTSNTLEGIGKDATSPEGYVEIIAITYNGAAQGGVASVVLTLNTATGDIEMTGATRLVLQQTFVEMTEQTDPAAPGANRGRLYVRDNGAGKSQLCVRFASGAVQVIATEP